MATEVRTPFCESEIQLSAGDLWRKQVLRFDTIWYTGRDGKRRKITFDQKYGKDVIAAFKAGAYPQVPFQIADAENRHNNDPTRTGGEVVGLELSRDGSGVDALLRTWGDGTRVVEQNPKIGVSARILENQPQPDGRVFPRVIQHVLATVDPQMRDMHPWEKVRSVDLSNEGAAPEVLELSGEVYEGGNTVPEKNGVETLELSTTQKERLLQILDDDEAFEALAEELGPDFFAQFEDEDEETSEDEDTEEDEVEPTDLSVHGGSEALELAQAQIDSQGQQLLELSTQLRDQRTEADVQGYLRQDLAPAVLEAARPLLAVESGNALELSTAGERVDPGAVIREVLDTVIELSRTGHLFIDSTEVGSLEGSEVEKSTRAAMLADWEKNYS